ncbi:hypothetical protein HN51_040552 [Arachis hypogaea]
MSASQWKGKGKATDKRKRGDSSQSIVDLMHDTSWNLYLERTLRIPEALQQYTTEQIKQRGCSQPSPISLMVIKKLRRTCA